MTVRFAFTQRFSWRRLLNRLLPLSYDTSGNSREPPV